MLLPRAVLDSLLFLAALWTFVAPPLSLLLPIALVLPLLLLSMLLPIVLVLSRLLLSMLLPITLVLPLLLLSMLLPIALVLPLLLLSVLLLGSGLLVLTLLLLGMVLFFVLVLCVSRRSDSEKQRQNGCTGDINCVHVLSLFLPGWPALVSAGSQWSRLPSCRWLRQTREVPLSGSVAGPRSCR